jgi:hypothetical protein
MTRLVSRLLGSLGMLTVFGTCAAGLQACRAAEPACPPADVWVVSTRRLPCIKAAPLTADVAVERCVDPACGRWERSDLARLLDDPARPLQIFIHGNRYAPGEAKAQGLKFDRHVAAACSGAAPVRTVIFSWPSEQEKVLLRDGRAKYARAHADGHYLGWLLGHIPAEQPVAIVAYSFGALITAEALQDLVAADRSGRVGLQPWTTRAGRTHIVFIAPAVRCDAFAPRGPYRETLAGCDRLSLVINSHDDALRFFPWLDKRVRADALGYVGMPRRWVPGEVEFTATDAAAIVGKNHGLPLYLASPALTRRIAAAARDDLAPGVPAGPAGH